MALLLCEGIGKACDGLCTGLSHLINLPCRICSQTCRCACDGCGHVLKSPFFPYLAVTLSFNLPPAVWGFRAKVQGCDGSSSGHWLLVNAIYALIHVLAAFYIVHQIQKSTTGNDVAESSGGGSTNPASSSSALGDPEKGTSKEKQQPAKVTRYERVTESTTSGGFSYFSYSSSSRSSTLAGEGTWARMIQVIGYDIGVALYIVVFLAWLVWQSIGVSRILGGDFDGYDGNGGACGRVHSWATNSLVLGWMYMMVVCASFCCSLCCLRPV